MIVPTISELYESIKSDLRNKLNISSLIGKMVLLAFAAVQAAKLKIYYLAISKVNQNIFVDTCDDETIRRFGFVKLNRYPNPATSGEYEVSVSGVIGAVIPQGTTFKSLDTSTSPDKMFVLDSLFTFTGTTGTITLRAMQAGSESLLDIGDELQLTSPLANVDSFGTVTAVTVTPINEEDIEEYRSQVIQAYRLEPQGGAKVDYMLWGKGAAGVRKIYPYVTIGSAGDIDLYIEAFVDDSSDGKGTPTAAILLDVESVVELDPDTTKPIEERGRRPMGVFNINFLPITPLDIDITIVGLSPTVDVVAIENAVTSFLSGIRPFIDGGDNPNERNDKLYEADIYKIVRDLLKSGEAFTSISLSVDGTPETIYTFEDGDIPYLNSITA